MREKSQVREQLHALESRRAESRELVASRWEVVGKLTAAFIAIFVLCGCALLVVAMSSSGAMFSASLAVIVMGATVSMFLLVLIACAAALSAKRTVQQVVFEEPKLRKRESELLGQVDAAHGLTISETSGAGGLSSVEAPAGALEVSTKSTM